MYDYWLGGHDNFAADRAAALKMSEAAPEAQLMAVENRSFLYRAVRHLAADAGITQFLDIGTRLSIEGNVRQIAQDINRSPGGVCDDPMVLAHSRALKTGGEHRFFVGLELIDPGLVQVPYWRPGGPDPADAGKVWIPGGVGCKPGPSPAERM
jgi:hypothetical protein